MGKHTHTRTNEAGYYHRSSPDCMHESVSAHNHTHGVALTRMQIWHADRQSYTLQQIRHVVKLLLTVSVQPALLREDPHHG